jgi:formylglycine-generating enzyme required for sulfatase activity
MRDTANSRVRRGAALSALLLAAAMAPAHAAALELPTSHGGVPGRHGAAPDAMVAIPSGAYHPLYARAGARARVSAFAIDRGLVTRGEFLAFVRGNPEWRRSGARPAFAEGEYLEDWASDLDAGNAAALQRPVTNVSWFAARAYCAAQGKRLPTTDEWEYVAAASEVKRDATGDAGFLDRLVAMYSARPRTVGITNVYGVRSMHGPVWEWTLDFNGGAPGDSSGMHAGGHHMFCASAAIGANDLTNYPAFLRAAMRAGVTGRTTLDGLGFRCAADVAA